MNNLIFSIGYQILKIQFFEMALKNVQAVIQIALKNPFFPKITKIFKKPLIASGGRGPCPQTTSVIRLSYISFFTALPQ